MAKFNIISQFMKDISFESPNVPELFFNQEENQAKLEINIDVQVQGAENNLFMVDLITKVHSRFEEEEAKEGKEAIEGKTIFLIESVYSGLVQIEEKQEEEENKKILLIDVPNLLFPTVRSMVARLTSESGFPTFTMQQVDFEEIYKKKIEAEES